VNILEIEDMVKGLPDQALQKEARMPSGQVPQFLVVSEIQRRGDMRQRFQKRQENQGTVKDQVMQQGIAAMGAPQPEMQALAGGPAMPTQGMPPQMPMQQPMPPQMAMQQPPMGMYAGGVIRMNEGGSAPVTEEDKIRLADRQEQNYLKLLELRDQGVSDMQIAQAIQGLGLNPNIFNQLGLPTLGTMESTMQPDAYDQDAYADIFARQQGDIPAGMEFVEPRTTDDLLSPQAGFTTREMAQSQTLPNVPVERPAPSQRGIGSAPEGTADALQAQIQALRSTPASPATQADFAIPDFAMPDFASYRQAINTSLAPPPATGRRDVGNLLGSDMLPPSSVDGSAPVSALPAVDNSALAAQLVAESQARRNQEASAAVGTFDAPPTINNALIEELIAGSEERRNREPSPAVGTFDAPAPQDNALIEQLIAGSEARRNQEPSPAVGDFSIPRVGATRTGRESADPDMSVLDYFRIENQVQTPRQKILSSKRTDEMIESFDDLEANIGDGSNVPADLGVDYQELIDIANNQSGAVQTDGNRGVLTDSVTDSDVVDLALAKGTSADASGRSATVGDKDKDRTGAGGGKAVQGTGSAEGRLAGRVGEGSEFRELAQAGSIRRAGELSGRMSLAEMIENQERPTLSYQGLISDYEKQMESQLADIKREKGSQALIALGAGIARGDLGAGLSDAGKAAAASNAQKRALETRQQAMQMGLKKSEIDAAFQSEVQQQANKLEAQKTRISALESYGAKQDAAEQAVLNFENGIDTTLANIGIKRDYYDQLSEQQKETSRRAILNYVEGIISRQNMAGQDKQAQGAMRQQLLREAANILNVPVGEISGSTNEGEGEDQVIEFDDQGKRI
jgi:hypothetical protein